jgi:hypothetical protein
MFKAMLYKELREAAGIAAIALALFFYFTVKAMRHDLLPWFASRINYEAEIPFVGSSFLTSFGLISAALAIALGFRQSVGESIHGTWLFLLHRPVARRKLIGVKLLAGVGVYLVCAAAAILALACWAATPGTHASPFEWSMTAPAWKVWLTMPIVYLAAFLSGIRPARWVGTRLLPLAAIGALAALIPYLPWWPLCGLGLIVLLCVMLVGNIFYVAEVRDF